MKWIWCLVLVGAAVAIWFVKEPVEVLMPSPTPIPVVVAAKPGYVKLDLSFEDRQSWAEYEFSGKRGLDDPDEGYFLYLPKSGSISIPAVLSDYEFMIIANFHWSFQHYGLGKTELASRVYTEVGNIETPTMKLSKYSGANGWWIEGQLTPKNDRGLKLDAGIVAHAMTEENLQKMLAFAQQRVNVEDYLYPSSHLALPRRKVLKPNYTDLSGKYRLNPGSGFTISRSKYGGDLQLRRKKDEEQMCIPLKGVGQGECGFSSSGCTCCNTGCQLHDVALFADKGGGLHVSGVLSKGNSGDNVRFLYGEDFDDPWFSGSAAYSKQGIDYHDGVVEFLKIVGSVDRIE